jgi:hypothetical protein
MIRSLTGPTKWSAWNVSLVLASAPPVLGPADKRLECLAVDIQLEMPHGLAMSRG